MKCAYLAVMYFWGFPERSSVLAEFRAMGVMETAWTVIVTDI